MKSFKIPEWESNSIADKAVDDLSNVKKLKGALKSKGPKKSKKQLKKAINKKIINKDAIKHSVDNNLVTVRNSKTNATIKNVNKKRKTKDSSSNIISAKTTNVIKHPVQTSRNLKKKIIKEKIITIQKNKTKKEHTTVSRKFSEVKVTSINKPKKLNYKISNKSKTQNVSKSLNSKAGNNKNESSKEGIFREKLKVILTTENKKKTKKNLSLREKMLEKLKAARFRYINQEMYTSEGKDAQKVFKEDPESFQAYHEGYRQQVNMWPLNPLDVIIKSILKMSKDCIIADFGCGDAKLAASVPQKVHSFDLVASNPSVTACDMAHVPLENSSVDVTVFCLSLMGTNLRDYLLEANRVLKTGGTLKIAEVESRFDTVDTFIKGVENFGFTKTMKDLSHNLFYFLNFKKQNNVNKKHNSTTVSLHPCMYKKR